MPPIVECRNVTKNYRQGSIDVPALRGVDLTIERADLATLSGPSGSGKSTLLNIIGGLDSPSGGSVLFDGVATDDLNATALADLRLQKIGFVFQAHNLIPVLSALENVEFILRLQNVPAEERHERAMTVLGRVGLANLEDRRPANLSGGQQQRVAVARALVSEPSIVLADEPTASLDSKTAQGLIDLIAELNDASGITFLIATHDDRLSARLNRHIELTDGMIASDSGRKCSQSRSG